MAIHNQFELAEKRARARLSSSPRAVSAYYGAENRRVTVELSSGLHISFSPSDAQGLEHATPLQLAKIEITPSGLGIHFPKLDADLYLPALLEGFLGSKKWMAARLGAAGGKSRTIAKRSAARVNGALGGRPKSKTAAVNRSR